ncbi:DUF885 domain-containing protein [Halomarina oriensis]|uniref:DUF885 family protein n=1 Tax=Halomarina oriensis TaxID=671145 RepID=A0A6B0GIW9_9EURY|nr:DUF885 domain-containing protein [Halomarina oriensis]MWG33419.1 DUF885 family protein [Halomarina oriensis]
MATFDETVDEFLETYWRHHPVEATHAGVHRYDGDLPDTGPGAAREWREAVDRFTERFEAFDPAELDHDARLDRRWALAVLEKLRIDAEMRPWERAPRHYLDTLGNGLHDLLLGDRARRDRFEALLARLDAVPEFLSTAESTLDPPSVPPVWVDAGLRTTRTLRQFVDDGIPEAAGRVPDLESDIVAASERAADAITAFEAFLHSVEARADGDFAVGRDRFDRLLRDYHLLEMDADDLHEFGREWVDRYEREMETIADGIDPGSDWVTVLERIKRDHPAAEDLRQAYEDETMLAREHCVEHDLITIPDGEEVSIEWTPSYMRDAYPIAKPWTTAPFEEGLAGKWYVTGVDPTEDDEARAEHLRDHSWAWIRAIAQHEMYPGHHLHMAVHKQVATPLRKQFTSPIFVEGWGLYTEELFYETGLLDEPELRLMQLRNGLWRAVRIVVDTGLHTREMTAEEATDLLVDRARLERRWAETEVQRYTTRPTYPSSYRIGLTQLMDLRETYREQRGEAYDRKEFHDELMAYSILPVGMIADELL